MKYAIVTGASTGIGRGVAIELANHDFEIALIGRNEKELNKTKKLIEKSGGIAKTFITDLSNVESVNKLVDDLKISSKTIDLLANIAGIWHGTDQVYANIDFEKFNDKVLLDTMNVGIIAPMLLVKNLLPLMSNDSLIINLSGTFENGGKGWLPYYVSKRALEDFTLGLSDELKAKDIRINCISPSDTATESYKKYFPEFLEESLDPKEIAKLVVKFYFESKETGKTFVIKKGQPVFEAFHH